MGAIRLFALRASASYGEKISRALGVPLADHEERSFEDGEHKSRPLENVRNQDVYVVQSLYGDHEETVNDKLCRLLFFIGSVSDAGAASVTAVAPYLCYSRKDRKTKPRDPVTTKYVAQLFEAVGTDRVVTLDVHNLAAFQNAFRISTEHLEAKGLFVDHFAHHLADEDISVISPDIGGVKRAESFREALANRLNRSLGTGFMEKQRSMDVVSGDVLVGEIAGRSVILLDDLISTGTTMARVARVCRERGARAVYAAASHGLFVKDAGARLQEFDEVVVTDTVPPFRLEGTLKGKLVILDAAALIAEAIERIHAGGSIVSLLEST